MKIFLSFQNSFGEGGLIGRGVVEEEKLNKIIFHKKASANSYKAQIPFLIKWLQHS